MKVMDLLRFNDLDHSLLICPDGVKRNILNALYHQKKIIDVKFLTKSEFLRKKYFDYDEKAIKYLIDTYDFSVPNAKEILDSLYYVDIDQHYDNEKLDGLVAYQKELKEKGLLIYDPLFEASLKGRKIYVVGYGDLTKEEAFRLLGEVLPYEERKCRYDIAVFEEIEEEVLWLYESIRTLIYEKGVDINTIYVLHATSDHEAYFKKFNAFYPFRIETEENDTLIGTSIGKEFLSMIDSYDKEAIYEYFKEKEDELSAKILSIINRYPSFELQEVKKLIEEDLKQTKIRSEKMKDIVHRADLFEPFEETDHVFLLGFNDSFPSLVRDTDYITDNIAPLVNKSDSEERNAISRKNVKAYLSTIPGLSISYFKKTPFHSYEFSNLLESADFDTYTPDVHSLVGGYNALYLGSLLDDLYRYGDKNEDLDRLYQSFAKVNYKNYDNHFNGLSESQKDKIGRVTLSYSSMQKFYECPFAYYLDKVLCIIPYDDTFATKKGSLCHGVLKDYYEDPSFDFETSWQKNLAELSAGFENAMEEYFALKIKEELKEDLRIIADQKAHGHLNKQLCEKQFKVDVDKNLSFFGIIDKVMYSDYGEEVIANVIDYKTGNSASISEKLMPYGLSLQLPSYMFLLSESNLFHKPVKFGGFYLQYLVNNELKYDEKKSEEEIKAESMKLEGFSSDVVDRLSFCDDTLEEGSSQIIKGLKLTKSGALHKGSRTISDEGIKEKIALTKDKILTAGKAIQKGEFPIEPKQIDGDNVSCTYCPFWGICYRRDSDIRMISTKEEKDA